ncbi:hypothetical protein FE257_005783 [Aspergillus nanangensis]|uniref:DUF7702 domain-containing protein n=1 Tax=Aspergillus nanangensis TaxID=2582783 RepID=A0AAD4GVB6_ASPNN|nr:hypothetical protein FE257_005783 [Aspergillus nanangensis]
MTPHEILACIELGIYCILVIPVTLCTWHYLWKRQTGWLYLHAFTFAKILGPAIYLSISNQSNPSRDAQMAAQILYQIALGPLLSAALSFVNTSRSTSTSTSSRPEEEPLQLSSSAETARYSPLVQTTKGAPLHGLLRLLHPVVITGLVLGIISGIDRAPDSSGSLDDRKYVSGVSLAKASAALFFLVLVGITLGIVSLWKSRRQLSTVSCYITSCMAAIMPCLFLRVLYSILGASNQPSFLEYRRGNAGKFDVLRGSWVAYFFLGLVPQALVLGAYAGCGVLAWVRERRGKA